MNQIDELLRSIRPPDVPVAADVRRGELALRRRRIAVAGGVVAAAVVAAAGGWLLAGVGGEPGGTGRGRDDVGAAPSTSDPFTGSEPTTWASLQPTFDSPLFPGSDPLLVPLDANTVPALEVLVPLLDAAGEHVRPPAASASPEVRDGRPTRVTVYLGWVDDERAYDVEVRLAESRAAAQWECATACEEHEVQGGTMLTGVTDGGKRAWGMQQDDGEWVTVFGEAGRPLTEDQIVSVLTSDIDLPERDLTPEPPDPAVTVDVMRAIGEEVLDRGDRRIATEVDRANRTLGGRLTVGGRDVAWVGWSGTPLGEVVDPVTEENCDSNLFTRCEEWQVHGRTVVVAYDDRYPDADGDGTIRVFYDGPLLRTSVWTSFHGQVGTETPAVPYEDIYAILFDERWQQEQ